MAASSLSPALLLMAHSPDAGAARPDLEDLLGRERCAALEAVLVRRAVSWAADVAPGRLLVAYEPADAESSIRSLAGDATELFAQTGAGLSERLGAAVAHAFDVMDGPVLVVWPDLPVWRREHALSALDDIGAGCDVSVGPVFDGGFYLVALSRPAPALFELPDEAWHGADAMGLALAVVHQAGLQAGLVRPERGLRRPADVRAALADPLTDPELVAILRGH